MRRGTFVRWGVPIAAAAVIAAAVGAGPVIAAVSGAPPLPERSARQLLADAAAAAEKSPPPMSGTVQQTASLGLPALPATGTGSPLALLSGSHEVKVWYGAHGKFRIAMPTQLNETNLIVNGGQGWYWDSAANTATKLSWQGGAVRSPDPAASAPAATPGELTPQAAAAKLLEQAGEHTAIRVINTAEVAGRPVYQLVLAPKDDGSLVQEVRLALDGETYVPLQVQVFAKGAAEPAFQVGFTQVTFTPPAEENFTFTPPAGAKVEERTLGPGDLAGEAEHRGDAGRAADRAADGLKVVGDGWTQVAVVKASAADLAGGAPSDAPQGERRGHGGDAATGQAALAGLLKSATPVSGPWGSGRLISTKLVTALLTDDGRLLVGAVTPEEITEAAGVR
ncbi:outer membrane lipoprotein carrier protein LolA [Nonomuraea sp. NPDC047897]|uniref:LolA family protein n=1 Tax=Nonomuraea sp. NPDC047897 TaxID=3364346 RepID=UPI0037180D1E